MTGGRTIRLRELLLGYEGVALLRGLVDGSDEEMQARIEEIRNIATSMDNEPWSVGINVPELDARAGYAHWSRTYDAENNPLLLAEQPTVEEITSSLPRGRALDAACGTGRHAEHLARTHDVTGVDGSPEMLGVAAAKVPSGRFVQGDLRSIPCPDATYDVVVCALALCHFDPLAPPIVELARVARPGARLVLTDPHPQSAIVFSQALFPTEGGGMAFVRNHAHFVGTYLDAFARAGLRVIACHEPLFKEEFSGGLPKRFIPGAALQALVGVPFAIVWELERAPT
jgi:ubiquinone/menaquinone biosynthesis C-methylase UbiE